MKKLTKLILNLTIVTFIMGISTTPLSAQSTLDNYITSFDYEARKEMKVSSEEIVNLLISGDAILLDIRFEEEQQSWAMPYAMAMPLPKIPGRIEELDKSKTIVAACPHRDRAIIAMMYLKSKGFDAKYLNEGLLGLAEYLRGDRAREFIKELDNK
ncbi:rhodanese-like domain-containing protein [Fodinibius sp.]|uniref:rhodanese-like domain-containing protein n=1 Tax=Fodinibius sp. TaxID=1872440 RepID=UPI002ACE211D|nr:rhodanese-like domain-containing protein [Fodinibius sp.]MDZ7660413.1 rhodanese-like domain-containing protein [Fodinibius sp.]